MKDEGEGSVLDSSSVSCLGNRVDPFKIWTIQKNQLWTGCDDGSSCEATISEGPMELHAMTIELQE